VARSGARLIGRTVEVLLLAGGIACVGWVYLQWFDAQLFQHRARELFVPDRPAPNGAERRPARDPIDRSPAEMPSPAGLSRDVLGVLDVPRVGLSIAVVEGDDAAALAVAVGHLPRTPLPWDVGNAVLAGHRDNFFGPLKSLRLGDAIRLTTYRGTFTYAVRDIRIVQPQDVWILSPADGIDLTLITCYPFSYLGPAPQRFVVRAERNGGILGDDE
jgi:sortase A